MVSDLSECPRVAHDLDEVALQRGAPQKTVVQIEAS